MALSICPSVLLSRETRTTDGGGLTASAAGAALTIAQSIDIVFKVFSPSGNQAILVFACQTGWRCSDGTPLTGASNARGV